MAFKKGQRSTYEILKIDFFLFLSVHNFYVKSIFGIPEVLKMTVLTFLSLKDRFWCFSAIFEEWNLSQTKFRASETTEMAVLELVELSYLISRNFLKI